MNLRIHAKRFAISLAAACLVGLPTLEVSVSAASDNSKYDAAFAAAAREFSVPENLLKAIAYNQSRWNSNHGKQSIDGGYGIMDLTAKSDDDGDGDSRRHARGDWDDEDEAHRQNDDQTHYTLDEAAGLLKADRDKLKHDQTQNIRGAAAVLAQYGKSLNDGTLPAGIDDWYGALIAYSGSQSETAANDFADSVYKVLQSGVYASDEDGKPMSLGADSAAQPDKTTDDKIQLRKNNGPNAQQGAECPAGLGCRFVPAGYALNNPADATDYGNYDPANRPKDMDIKYIVIHDTEGSYDSAIKHFQDTKSYVSCHYIIRSSDGAVTQMVKNQDVSWCAGDWYVNMHSINIEHEGFAATGQQWYSDTMYQSSAKLVRWLADKYGVPLDRDHIIGHDNVPTATQAGLADQHWDPGPYWDWNKYMDLLQGKQSRLRPVSTPRVASIITMAPDFATNRFSLQDCSGTAGCVTLPEQSTSITFLRSAASDSAPLLTDATKHPDGKPGSTEISDWSASASSGERYAVAETQGDWVAIWFGSQKGWFHNPADKPVAFRSRDDTSVKPAGTAASIPVYGRPVPEAAAFPAGVTPVEIVPLNYSIPAGQVYPALTGLTNDYYYDKTIDYSMPHDHEIFVGQDKYYQIQYNHRLVYVKASDVTLDR